MWSRLRELSIVRNLAAAGPRLRTSLRGNRIVPLVLAVISVLIFAWILFGLVLGGSEDESQGPQVSNQAAVSQSQEDGGDSIAPETENRDVDSYAAYESKDPFRRLLAPAQEESDESATPATTPEDADGVTDDGQQTGTGSDNEAREDGTGGRGSDGGTGDGGAAASNGDGGGGQNRGRSGGLDSDGDGIPDRRENELGLDPANPDTDGDGVRDGQDDSNGNGIPDGQEGGRSSDRGDREDRGGRNGADDNLFDSGGVDY